MTQACRQLSTPAACCGSLAKLLAGCVLVKEGPWQDFTVASHLITDAGVRLVLVACRPLAITCSNLAALPQFGLQQVVSILFVALHWHQVSSAGFAAAAVESQYPSQIRSDFAAKRSCSMPSCRTLLCNSWQR